jgi:hypothetical protein
MTSHSRMRSSQPRVTGSRRHPASSETERLDTGRQADPVTSGSSQIDLFDDYGLADSVAAITCRSPEAAREMTRYLLILLDGLGEAAPATVKRALEQSVKLAFQFTETFDAALELYTVGQRGFLTGPLSPKDLIRELVASRGARP